MGNSVTKNVARREALVGKKVTNFKKIARLKRL